MKKFIFLILALYLALTYKVYSTPSTHIWAPSCDVQPYKLFHLTADYYVPVGENPDGSFSSPVINSGLTVGILPFEKLQAEVGVDHIAGYGDFDKYPFYFNFKLGVPEGAISNIFPQVAFGMYCIGTKADLTDYNIGYFKVAKTINPVGKFSLGVYVGNEKLLLDDNGNIDNKGILFAVERTLSEISDKLWICFEYQSGRNSFGTTNVGFSYKFSDNTSLLFGVNFYNNKQVAPTYTIQTDIDF